VALTLDSQDALSRQGGSSGLLIGDVYAASGWRVRSSAAMPYVAGVLVADTPNVRAMTHPKVKNDRVDEQLLAKLLAAGMLPGTWVCDEHSGAPSAHQRGLAG
jgi:hypothetical protein